MLRFIAVPFRLCVQDKENMSVCNLHLNLAKKKKIMISSAIYSAVCERILPWILWKLTPG